MQYMPVHACITVSDFDCAEHIQMDKGGAWRGGTGGKGWKDGDTEQGGMGRVFCWQGVLHLAQTDLTQFYIYNTYIINEIWCNTTGHNYIILV